MSGGQFKKGYDPRRARGEYHHDPEAKARRINYYAECRKHSVEALDFLADLVQDPDQPVKERRAAAEFIIEQSWGKAVDRVAVQNLSPASEQEVKNIPLPDLRKQVMQLVQNPVIEHSDGE